MVKINEKECQSLVRKYKKTGKILLIAGPIFFIIGINIMTKKGASYGTVEWGFMALLMGFVGIIYGIFAYTSVPEKNIRIAMERKAKKEELRKAQLAALKKGNVSVEIKGKMRKLR